MPLGREPHTQYRDPCPQNLCRTPRKGQFYPFFFHLRNTRWRKHLPAGRIHSSLSRSINWMYSASSESPSSQWKQVRFDHTRHIVTITLAGADPKTSEPRMVVMGGDLYETLDLWYRKTREQYPNCFWVCHWKGWLRALGESERKVH